MCKYIETVRFCIAQLLYQQARDSSKMSIFHFKMVQHQLKVYSSLIKAEVEPSLNPVDHNFHRGQTG